MKRVLSALLTVLVVILASCAPAVDAAREAATASTNSLTCDAVFKAVDTGLFFASQGLVNDAYFTIQGEGIETPHMVPVEGSEGLFDLYYDGIIQGSISIEITKGEYVGVVSYQRDSIPKACVAN